MSSATKRWPTSTATASAGQGCEFFSFVAACAELLSAPLAEAETLSKQPSGLFVVEGETIVEPAGCRQGPSLIADELSPKVTEGSR